MSIFDKLQKNEFIKGHLLSDSEAEKPVLTTDIPMINVALSGSFDGGMYPGVFQIAGPSKHFKSGFAVLLAGYYLRQHEDAALLFYDSEGGIPRQYFRNFGVDEDRVWHVRIKNIEELKFDLMKKLEALDKNDKVMIIIDSVGNLASKKEVEDAINEKSVADMTRAKALKSLFRIVTPYTHELELPLVVINHTYKEIGLYPKDIVSGGTGSYYSSDTIWVVGRQQEKDNQEIKGYHFIIRIEKSRHVREGVKVPITVSFENGINLYSGLFDVALEGGFITNPKKGWYQLPGDEKSYRAKELVYNEMFWEKLLKSDEFNKYITSKYRM